MNARGQLRFCELLVNKFGISLFITRADTPKSKKRKKNRNSVE
jgi:hypothetical protein